MLIDFIAYTKTRKNKSSTTYNSVLIERTTGGIEEKKHELRETFFCGVESHLSTEPTSQLFLHSWLPVL